MSNNGTSVRDYQQSKSGFVVIMTLATQPWWKIVRCDTKCRLNMGIPNAMTLKPLISLPFVQLVFTLNYRTDEQK